LRGLQKAKVGLDLQVISVVHVAVQDVSFNVLTAATMVWTDLAAAARLAGLQYISNI